MFELGPADELSCDNERRSEGVGERCDLSGLSEKQRDKKEKSGRISAEREKRKRRPAPVSRGRARLGSRG